MKYLMGFLSVVLCQSLACAGAPTKASLIQALLIKGKVNDRKWDVLDVSESVTKFVGKLGESIDGGAGQALISQGLAVDKSYQLAFQQGTPGLKVKFGQEYKTYLNRAVGFLYSVALASRSSIEGFTLLSAGFTSRGDDLPDRVILVDLNTKTVFQFSIYVDGIAMAFCDESFNMVREFYREERNWYCSQNMFFWNYRTPYFLDPRSYYIGKMTYLIAEGEEEEPKWWYPSGIEMLFEREEVKLSLK